MGRHRPELTVGKQWSWDSDSGPLTPRVSILGSSSASPGSAGLRVCRETSPGADTLSRGVGLKPCLLPSFHLSTVYLFSFE